MQGKIEEENLLEEWTQEMSAYSISKFCNWNNSGGSFPDMLLLSRRLQSVKFCVISQKYKHLNSSYIKKNSVNVQ